MWWLWACGPVEPVARFEEARALCGWSSGPFEAELAFGEPRYPSEDCVDRVLEDFSVQVEALLEVDALEDAYGVVRGEPVLHTRLGTLLAGVQLMGRVDLGSVEALPGSGWAAGRFAQTLSETARSTGQYRAGGALYDWIASRIEETGYGPTGIADAALSDEAELSWDLTESSSFDALGLLVHEARHADGARHVPCGEGRGQRCDATTEGAIGFQIGVLSLLSEASPDDQVRSVLQERMRSLASKIR